MVYRMHNLLNSKKAQFFVLSAFAIITTLFFLSQWIEPSNIIDTSSVAFQEEFFVFNNIKEKAEEVVKTSGDCNNLKFNLEEFKQFAEDYAFMKNMNLKLNYTMSCIGNSIQNVDFNITLISSSASIQSIFRVS